MSRKGKILDRRGKAIVSEKAAEEKWQAAFEVRPALFLDLDGTVRKSKSGEFIDGPKDIELIPGMEDRIWEWKRKGYMIFGISNQGGIAYGIKTVKETNEEMVATTKLFKQSPFLSIKFSPHHPEGNTWPFCFRSLARKPYYGMLIDVERECFTKGIVLDLDQSVFVGDRQEDEDVAKAADIRFVHANDFLTTDIPNWVRIPNPHKQQPNGTTEA